MQYACTQQTVFALKGSVMCYEHIGSSTMGKLQNMYAIPVGLININNYNFTDWLAYMLYMQKDRWYTN